MRKITDITIMSLYRELVDELSLAQYRKLMFGDMTYKSKAERAKKASKSKKVHKLANEILKQYELTKEEFEDTKGVLS